MRKLIHKSRNITWSLLMLFLFFELFLRIIANESLVRNHYPEVYAFDSSLAYAGIPYIKDYIRRPSIDKYFRLNNHGFYGPDFAAEHPDSIFRIIVYGTSLVEGIWADQKESIPFLLGKRFSDNGYRVEVINCGISGAERDLQNLRLVSKTTRLFHPDLVLFEQRIPLHWMNYFKDVYKGYSISFAGNNEQEYRHSWWIAQKKVELLHRYKLVTDMYDMFYSVRVFTRYKLPELADNGTLQYCWQTYERNTSENWQYLSRYQADTPLSISLLNILSDTLTRLGSKLILFNCDNPEMEEYLKKKQDLHFSHIYLNIDLNRPELRHTMDMHPNLMGYQLIAARLYDKLIKKDIPRRFSQ